MPESVSLVRSRPIPRRLRTSLRSHTQEGYRLAVLAVYPRILRQCLGDPNKSDEQALREARNHAKSLLNALENALQLAV